MPKSRGRKRTSGPRRAPKRRPRTPGARPTPRIDDLVRTVVDAGRDLLEVEDPLEAELWASSMLGTFYKASLPLDVRDRLERELGPAIVVEAERRADAQALAVLRAIAAVAEGGLAREAEGAAGRLAAAGIHDPVWAGRLGSAGLLDAWVLRDPYDDQEGYYATFRYPGRRPHMLMALYDQNLGGIVKDAFARVPVDQPADIRERARREPGARVEPVDPGGMARRVVDAIGAGDLYLDNDWTEEFKQTRALLLSRMRSLPMAPPPEPTEPLPEQARAALTEEFLASAFAPAADQAASIVAHCLDARCDYGDGDPLRWSPIVVELFTLDFLPRKAFLDAAAIRELPAVLRGWVRLP